MKFCDSASEEFGKGRSPSLTPAAQSSRKALPRQACGALPPPFPAIDKNFCYPLACYTQNATRDRLEARSSRASRRSPHPPSDCMDYRDAGVDLEAGRQFIERIRRDVASTQRPEVLGELGGFAGCCRLPSGYRDPVLVAGTDGVGTKLLLAQALNRHDTIGIDLVAMCVNDVLAAGAEPLFFLDYLATGRLEPAQLAEVVSGIARACRESGCALLGGETAEMPGFYARDQYDLAGFCVGVAERDQILDGSRVQVGDAILGLASAGLHSNGFSLVRRIVAQAGASWADSPPELGGASLGEVLLVPTRLYVAAILGARQAGIDLHGLAHITGGGLPENLPRALGPGQAAQLDPQSWPRPAIFDWLARAGSVAPAALFDAFNMGIGFVALVPPAQVEASLQWFASQELPAYQIGEVVAGDREASRRDSRTVLGLPC